MHKCTGNSKKKRNKAIFIYKYIYMYIYNNQTNNQMIIINSTEQSINTDI